MDKELSDFELTDVNRHWSPTAETFAGVDALVTMLHEGWRIHSKILKERCTLSGTRQITVYLIELERDDQTTMMRVLCNPYITRLLSVNYLHVAACA